MLRCSDSLRAFSAARSASSAGISRCCWLRGALSASSLSEGTAVLAAAVFCAASSGFLSEVLFLGDCCSAAFSSPAWLFAARASASFEGAFSSAAGAFCLADSSSALLGLASASLRVLLRAASVSASFASDAFGLFSAAGSSAGRSFAVFACSAAGRRPPFLMISARIARSASFTRVSALSSAFSGAAFSMTLLTAFRRDSAEPPLFSRISLLM